MEVCNYPRFHGRYIYVHVPLDPSWMYFLGKLSKQKALSVPTKGFYQVQQPIKTSNMKHEILIGS